MTTTSLRECYDKDGFVTGIDVFTDSDITSFRNEFDNLVVKEGKEKSQNAIVHRHFDVPFIWHMATDRRLVDVMEQIMGPDVMLLSTGFFCKYPEKNAQAFVGWHQDTHYWGLDPPIAYSAWIAIDDSDAANGAMQVVRGSQLQGVMPHGTSEREGNLLRIYKQDRCPGRAVGSRLRLFDVRCDVSHGQSAASSVRAVGLTAMQR